MVCNILPQNFTIQEDPIDRMGDSTQELGASLVLAGEITDLRSRIARS